MDGALLRPSEWGERAGEGWRWWLSELFALLPARLRDVFSTGDDAILITPRSGEFVVSRRTSAHEYLIARVPRDDFAARTLRLSVPPSNRPGILADPVILQLPPDEALSRIVALPAGARGNLDGILRHEITRHSPIGADDIYYDYHVLGHERFAGTLSVGLRIVRRDAVDALVQSCRDAGIVLSAIEFADDGARAAGGTFPADPAAARRLRLRPRIVPALVGCMLLLALGLVSSVYWRGHDAAVDLARRVEAARARAVAVEHLQDQLDAANRQATFLTQQRANTAAIAVMAKVARTLPDNAWLYQFELNGDEVRLHGFSSSAASLIALFDASPYFRDTEMRSPLMQGPDRATQRFDIAFKVRPVQ